MKSCAVTAESRHSVPGRLLNEAILQEVVDVGLHFLALCRGDTVRGSVGLRGTWPRLPRLGQVAPDLVRRSF